MKRTKNKFRQFAAYTLAAALTCAQPLAFSAENTFSGDGPFGGRVTSVKFDPDDAQRVYALGFRNGMFASDDGGVTWSRFDVDHPSIRLGSISSFGIDPNATSTLWVVDGGGEVARTTDRGATWTVSTTGLPSGLSTITVDQANIGTLFVDNSSALFRSTDNGDTWTDVSAGLGDTPRTSIMQSTGDPTIFMALTWDGPFKSTDSGQTWTLMANTLPLTANGYVFANYGVFDPNNSDIVLISVSNQGNWRTLDGGATWEAYGSGIPNDFFTEIVRDPSNSTRLYMGTGNNDLIVSSNNGLSWGAADLSGLGQYTVNDIAFDPATPNRMLVGTSTKGVFASTDSGANWTLSTEGFVNINVDSLAVNSGDGRMYAGTSGGTATSTNEGQTWATNEGTYDLQTFALEVDPVLSGHAYAGSSCCGLYETFNAGVTWTRIDLELTGVVASWVTDIDIPETNSQQLLFTDFNRGLFGTTDAGVTWTQLSTTLELFFTNNVSLEAVDASLSNNSIIFAVSSNFQDGGVFRSDDLGGSWSRKSGSGILGPARTFSVAIHPQNPNIVYAGSSGVFRSIDGGDSWSFPANDGTGVSGVVLSIYIDSTDPQLMYAISENNGLYRSVDGGDSWVAAPDDGTTARTNDMAVDPTDRGRVLIGYDDIGYKEITFSTDLELSDTTGPVTAQTGDDVNLSLTATANGPIAASSVLVETTIADQFTVVSAVASSGACVVDLQEISCMLGTLNQAESASIDLTLVALTDGDSSVVATATSLESDPDSLNNSVTLEVAVGTALDTDSDGINDSLDNCTDAANPNQTDSDADGYGNACDADFNNDCLVNFLDLSAFSGEFLGANANFDINDDGAVNFVDFVFVSQQFLQLPGPGLGSCQ